MKGPYCKRSDNIIKKKKLDLFNEDIIKELSKKYNRTFGQIILNWHVHLGVIPIPGTSNPNRMKENLNSIEFIMEEDDYNKLLDFAILCFYLALIYSHKIFMIFYYMKILLII